MSKGIAILLEAIIAGAVLLSVFRFLVPRSVTEFKWDDALLLATVRDALVSLDRRDGVESLMRNSSLVEERLSSIFPDPYIWYAVVEFSNGTKIELVRFRHMVSAQTAAYFDVYKENLLLNPSFEFGLGGDASNWTEGTDHSRAYALSYTGNYSMRSNFTGAFSSTISDPVRVKPNTMYVLRGWINNSLEAGSAYLDLNDIAEECEANSTLGLNRWEYVYCVFITGPATTEVRVRLVTENTEGEVWFDDVGIDEFIVADLRLFVGYPF